MARRDRATACSPRPADEVVEIGCGTGMILLRLAGRVRSYLGTDISPRALDYVRAHWARGARREPAACARRRCRRAGRTSPRSGHTQLGQPVLPQRSPTWSASWQSPGNDWHPAAACSSATCATSPRSSCSTCPCSRQEPSSPLEAAGERAETDGELCVDPRYFHALAARLPGAAAVDVQVKRGRADTEMNRFRYDVTLWRGPLPAAATAGLAVRDGSRLDLAR